MKTKLTFVLLPLIFVTLSSLAQDSGANQNLKKSSTTTVAKKQQAEPSDEKANKMWMEYMTPGPMHKMLAESNGVWREELTFWMTPDAPATKAEAQCTNTMIFGDRYQETVHTGTMMGMPFEGKGTTGYDNSKKMFQSTWVDNMGSGTMFLEGKYNESTRTLILKGNTMDPISGKSETVRQVMKFIDANNQLLEMYMTKDGKEFKNMEIKLTRKS